MNYDSLVSKMATWARERQLYFPASRTVLRTPAFAFGGIPRAACARRVAGRVLSSDKRPGTSMEKSQ
jgi:hypothetical protein